jgi:hypothetical protein
MVEHGQSGAKIGFRILGPAPLDREEPLFLLLQHQTMDDREQWNDMIYMPARMEEERSLSTGMFCIRNAMHIHLLLS